MPVVGVDESLASRCGLGLIGYVATSRIGAGEEVEGGEEVGAVIGVDKIIGCCCVDMESPSEVCCQSGCGGQIAK